jgi:ABC-type lipoprotein export system ATPase subunit
MNQTLLIPNPSFVAPGEQKEPVLNGGKEPVLNEVKEIIRLRQVVKTFHTAAGEYRALKGINLSFREREFVAVVGKSGSGKSTLLNMMTGIDHPSSGDVVIGGTNIYKMNESKRALWRGRNLGIVFQFFQLMPMLTLLENTMLPMDYCNVYPVNERPQRALALLDLVGLSSQAHKLPAAVSSGQQQSAAIARALATDPPIIVADEPTGNLDSRSADHIIALFDELASQNKTIIMVTHDPSITERTSRTVIIADGEIVDETVFKSFPLLSHRQMLEITRLIERRTYAPGTTILEQGQSQNHFFMIASGEVEVILQSRRCPETIITRLKKGEFFGELELLNGGNSMAQIRATTEQPVEVVMLDRSAFLKTLDNSPLTAEAITHLVQARLEENRQSSRRCR